MTELAITKSEFAEACGVDKSRVSQWIKERKISGAAIVGEGRGARIVPSIAKEQLKTRIDPSQRMGNGLKTKLDASRPQRAPVESPTRPATSFPASVWALIQDLPALCAWQVAARGATMVTAYLAYHDMATDLREAAERQFAAALPDDFEAPDWTGIAEQYGLGFDLALCQAEKARLDAI